MSVKRRVIDSNMSSVSWPGVPSGARYPTTSRPGHATGGRSGPRSKCPLAKQRAWPIAVESWAGGKGENVGNRGLAPRKLEPGEPLAGSDLYEARPQSVSWALDP